LSAASAWGVSFHDHDGVDCIAASRGDGAAARTPLAPFVLVVVVVSVSVSVISRC